ATLPSIPARCMAPARCSSPLASAAAGPAPLPTTSARPKPAPLTSGRPVRCPPAPAISASSGPRGSGDPASSWPSVRGRVSRNTHPFLRSPPAPGLRPPMVQAGVLERDGQAEAGAAGGPRAGRVGAPETVEDQVLLARPETHPVVPHRDRHRITVPGDRDHDIASLAVLDGV